MPPSLPKDSDNILVNSPEPYYTNEDVAILHDIVVHAEELLPSLPERERVPTNALFHAYYSILPSIGIDADHDSRYARVLFKIGGARSDGSLYDKFEAVLSRMGIEIQFDRETEGEGEGEGLTTEPGLDKSLDAPGQPRSAPAAVEQERGRRRSNSAGAKVESRSREHRQGTSRPRISSSAASTAHSTDISYRTNTASGLLNPAFQNLEKTFQYTQSRDGSGKEGQGYDLGAWLSNNPSSHPQRIRTRSASAHGSMRIKRTLPHPHEHGAAVAPISPSPMSDGVAIAPFSHFSGGGQEHQHLAQKFVQASGDLLNTKVTLLEQFRYANLRRQILSRWQQKSLQLREDNTNLELLAKHQDRQVLLRQALDSWHVTFEERRRRAETDRFFAHLERRADRARNIFLVSKAFSHWASSASYETQQTSIAQRHILRTRYFGAWRDLTVINELKVRRHVLRKFFPLWRRRYVAKSVNTEKAALYFMSNLVQRIFWAWFWAFCEKRAPSWRKDKMVGKQMAIWITVTKQRHEEDKRALDYYHRNMRRKICFTWLMKTYEYTTQRRQANGYRTASLCRNAIVEWRREAALFPGLHILHEKVELRLKHNSLNMWLLRARNESYATAVDRLKIIREAWVTWSDKFRCQTLQQSISDRVLFQKFYKWILAGRLISSQRRRERNMMQTSIQKMVEACQNLTRKESRDLRLAEGIFNHKLRNNTIQRWQDRLQTQIQQQRLALEFNSPVALSRSLSAWSSRSQAIQQLQTWAHNGQFYFLSNKALKSWKDAAQKAKKEKRRLAYAQFRRRYKLSLATRILSRWCQQAKLVIRMNHLSVEVYRDKSILICMEAFVQWRARIEELVELHSMQEQTLLKRCFNEMKSTLIKRRDLEMKAAVFFEDRATASCMKKWGRIYLQLRARQHIVFEVREKYSKKTSRKVLVHWRQRTLHGQDVTAAGNDENNNRSVVETRDSLIQSGDDLNDEKAEVNDEAVFSTPIPGYLSTPSKRMLRASSMARQPSTTPSAPLSTPIERQLRAQYSGGVLPSFRRRIGRSLLGREGTQLDLEGEFKTKSREDVVE